MIYTFSKMTSLTCLAAILSTTSAGAVQSGQSRSTDRSDYSRNSQSSQSQRDVQLTPQGWVRIAYDYDQDNQIDAVEWIFAYDLERARAASQNRMRQQQSMQQMQGQQSATKGQSSQTSYTVAGDIRSLRTAKYISVREPHLIAKIETSSGRTATVDLGPRHRLEQFNLRSGDRIAVQGFRGTINQQPMFLAKQVHVDGQTVNISRQRPAPMQATQGEIMNLRTLRTSSGNEHVFATLRLSSGKVTTVDLGPKQFIQNNADLSKGQQIAVLATPRRTQSGNLFLQAQRFRADGQMINVAQAMQRQQQQQQSQSQGAYGYSSPSEGQSAKQMTITAEDMEFSPSQLTCKPGETVKITLVNRGDSRHSIEFDLPNSHPSLRQAIQPDERGTVTFTAPSQPGQYTFYCPVADHAERGMKGTLIVRSNSGSSR